MKKSKIALKPYLDTIAGYCDALSNKELTDVIIRPAPHLILSFISGSDSILLTYGPKI